MTDKSLIVQTLLGFFLLLLTKEAGKKNKADEGKC